MYADLGGQSKKKYLKTWTYFLNGPHPAYFCLFSVFFQTQIWQKKTLGVTGIRTWIARVEYEHSDHLTTTKAQYLDILRWLTGPQDIILVENLWKF